MVNGEVMGHFKYGTDISGFEITWERDISGKEVQDRVMVQLDDPEDNGYREVYDKFNSTTEAPEKFLNLVTAYVIRKDVASS